MEVKQLEPVMTKSGFASNVRPVADSEVAFSDDAVVDIDEQVSTTILTANNPQSSSCRAVSSSLDYPPETLNESHAVTPSLSSSVSFPSSESSYPASSVYHHGNISTHIPPYRRISIPSAPNLLHRQSVASMASFDSLPEERPLASSEAALPPMKNGARKAKGRPPSLEVMGRRYSKKKETRPIDIVRESKRLKVIHEFHDTERAYVEGLDLIYSHFLTPIIASLDTPHPLLSRNELTSVFSNFVDIWNLHRSFFSSLTSLINSSTSSSTSSLTTSPILSPILLSHFPYLSLYSPFVTSFPAVISSMTTLLSTNTAFSSFIVQQEADPRCGRLKLRDWLLTIVQRCPRYLLLLKDLISCTDKDDPEYAQLMTVQGLVSKITVSLNTSLHTHSQTLALLSLQRSTPNLPFQLISPGRSFLKRGSLLQFERSSLPKEREFLLFSDCLIWLVNAEKGDGEVEEWDWGAKDKDKDKNKDKRKSMGIIGVGSGPGGRPPMIRTRSKSEAELTAALRARDSGLASPSGPTTPSTPSRPSLVSSPSKKKVVRHASSGVEEKWVYKSKIELVDLEVVVIPPREDGEERRLEILSPEGSFAVYAADEKERDEWSSAIRNAKESRLVSLNAMHPNSTLTSSASTHHLRRSLQALPHSPEEDARRPRRGKVEHFVPAIWIPDAKTESCMRCGRSFGWRRRRHHCRLCGRCVCASCSGKTFFISDSKSKNSTKSARACDACYDTVFPLLDHSADTTESSVSPSNSTLTSFPSWLSMPSLAMPMSNSTPEALMAMAVDVESPRRALHPIDDRDDDDDDMDIGISDGRAGTPTPRVRIRPANNRPRSYHQILEDFQGVERSLSSSTGSQPIIAGSPTSPNDEDVFRVKENAPEDQSNEAFGSSPPRVQFDHQPSTPTRRKEDTARRHKRFSLPAVALQTTPVTTRPNATGEGQAKRFSLVLGGRQPSRQGPSEVLDGSGDDLGKVELGSGVAAGKLTELLERGRS